jgi:hypothetical protein
VIDISSERTLRLDYSSITNDSPSEGKLTVYLSKLKKNQVDETILEFEDTALESLDITGMTLLNSFDLSQNYSLINNRINWHDYERRYLTWDTKSGKEYIIHFYVNPETFEYTLEQYPITTDIITSGGVEPVRKTAEFFGDSDIVYQSENGLCKVNYKTDELEILVEPEKLIEWKPYGEYIEVKLWKDSINVTTKIIDLSGNVLAENSTSFGAMSIIYASMKFMKENIKRIEPTSTSSDKTRIRNT